MKNILPKSRDAESVVCRIFRGSKSIGPWMNLQEEQKTRRRTLILEQKKENPMERREFEKTCMVFTIRYGSDVENPR